MSLSDLPDEKLIELCQQMDPQTLGRFMQVNWRMNQVCSEVLYKRRLKSLVGRWILVTSAGVPSEVHVSLSKDYLFITQDVSINSSYPQVLPNMRRIERFLGYERYTKFINISDVNQVNLLTINLKNYRKKG